MKCRLSGIKEISVMNYKDTLNMMKTDFPMRASLPQREPEILKKWYEHDQYKQPIPIKIH